MISFDGYNMIGLTEEDNKAIIEAVSQQLELTVDENNRVYTESGIYIADIKRVENGLGILCK